MMVNSILQVVLHVNSCNLSAESDFKTTPFFLTDAENVIDIRALKYCSETTTYPSKIYLQILVILRMFYVTLRRRSLASFILLIIHPIYTPEFA